jgi:5-hydroxyisourate hydrolase-like protein (transthyretin family)
VTVGESANVANINASLARGAHIAGTVTGTNGVTPLAGIGVSAYRVSGADWEWMGSASTDSAGRYDVGGLSTGRYAVGFYSPDGRYLDEWYDNRTDWESASTVTVSTVTTVDNINASLNPAARISGTVTGPGGTPLLRDISVDRYVKSGSDWTYADSTATDSNGLYMLEGLNAGTNRLYFRDESGVYLAEWYNDASNLTSAADIVVARGGLAAGRDASLARVPQTGISGKVTEEGSGATLSGIFVGLFVNLGPFWMQFDSTLTGSDGTYAFTGLSAGTYRLGFTDMYGMHVNEYYEDAASINAATDVAVNDGEMTEGRNAALTAIAQTGISGTVTEEGSGAALSGIEVDLYVEMGEFWMQIDSTSTVGDGSFTFTGLSAGTYRIAFVDGSGTHVDEYFDNEASIESATDIEVTGDQMTAGRDAELTPISMPTLPAIVKITGRPGDNWDVWFTASEGSTCVLQRTYSLSDDWDDAGSPTNCGSGTNCLGLTESTTPCYFRVRMLP